MFIASFAATSREISPASPEIAAPVGEMAGVPIVGVWFVFVTGGHGVKLGVAEGKGVSVGSGDAVIMGDGTIITVG